MTLLKHLLKGEGGAAEEQLLHLRPRPPERMELQGVEHLQQHPEVIRAIVCGDSLGWP